MSQKTHQKHKAMSDWSKCKKKKKAILEGNFNNTEHVLLNFPVKF